MGTCRFVQICVGLVAAGAVERRMHGPPGLSRRFEYHSPAKQKRGDERARHWHEKNMQWNRMPTITAMLRRMGLVVVEAFIEMLMAEFQFL